MEQKMEVEAVMFEPKYLIRHLVYEDFTRQRAYLRLALWVDDDYIEKMPFGTSIRSELWDNEGSMYEYLTVANYPEKIEVEYPIGSCNYIQQVDICFAPTEQWMLYQHARPEDISADLIVIIPEGEEWD